MINLFERLRNGENISILCYCVIKCNDRVIVIEIFEYVKHNKNVNKYRNNFLDYQNFNNTNFSRLDV